MGLRGAQVFIYILCNGIHIGIRCGQHFIQDLLRLLFGRGFLLALSFIFTGCDIRVLSIRIFLLGGHFHISDRRLLGLVIADLGVHVRHDRVEHLALISLDLQSRLDVRLGNA